MAEIHLPRILKGFDLYVNDQCFAGTCEKFKLPALNPKFETLNAGGLSRPIKVPVGFEEDWNVEFTTKGLEMGLLLNHACAPNDMELMILGSLGVGDTCEEHQLKAFFWGQIAESDTGDISNNELGETSVTFAVVKAQYFLNGAEILYEDALNMERRINGVDKLAKRRQNLGRK